MRISLCAIVLLPSVCESFKEMPKCTQEYRDTFSGFILHQNDTKYEPPFWNLFLKKRQLECREFASQYIGRICRHKNHTRLCDAIMEKSMSMCIVYNLEELPTDCESIFFGIFDGLKDLRRESQFTALLLQMIKIPCVNSQTICLTATMKFCEGIESIACRLIRDAITWAKKLSADEVSFLREFIKNELNKTTHFRGYAETFLRNKWVPDVNLSLSTSGCSATKNDTKDLICQEIFFRCNASEEVEPFKRICNEIAMEIDRANRPTLPPKKEDEPKKAGMSIYVFVGAGAAAFVVVAAVLFFIVFRRRRLQRRSSHTAKELDLSSQSGTPSPADSTAKTGSNAAQIGRQLERKSGTERAGKANGNN